MRDSPGWEHGCGGSSLPEAMERLQILPPDVAELTRQVLLAIVLKPKVPRLTATTQTA